MSNKYFVQRFISTLQLLNINGIMEYLVVTIFARKEKVYIYPCFPILFIQFSEAVQAVRNEST